MTQVTKGTTVRLTARYHDVTNALADPTAATVGIIDPTGSSSTATPTKDSTGVYHYDTTLSIVGQYQVNFKGTGTLQAVGEDTFITVIPSTVFP